MPILETGIVLPGVPANRPAVMDPDRGQKLRTAIELQSLIAQAHAVGARVQDLDHRQTRAESRYVVGFGCRDQYTGPERSATERAARQKRESGRLPERLIPGGLRRIGCG